MVGSNITVGIPRLAIFEIGYEGDYYIDLELEWDSSGAIKAETVQAIRWHLGYGGGRPSTIRVIL